MTRVKDAIAETFRGVCEESHIWGSRPVGVGYDSTAVPRGKKTEPPRDVAEGFAVHGDVVMWKACLGREVNKSTSENAARGDDPTRKIQLANQGEKFSFATIFTGGPRVEVDVVLALPVNAEWFAVL